MTSSGGSRRPGTPEGAGRLAAVVLAGGSGLRLGGTDKASIEIDGATLLEHAISATLAADEVVVVGNRVPTTRPVTWALEHPAGGGPAAGLLSGLDALLVAPHLVCVLAVDMPRVTAATITRLVDVVVDSGADVAMLVDEHGRRQPLAGVYRYSALLHSRPDNRGDEHGLAMRRLVSALDVAAVAARADEARDVDTWDDLRRLTD